MKGCAGKKLFVFDWNGTILSDTISAWRASNACLEHYGATAISLQKFQETFHFPVIHFYKRNGVSVDAVLRTKDIGNAVFQSAYDALAVRARTRRGARALLCALNQADIDCIILSNYMTDKIKIHLKRLGLETYFKHISAHDCNGTTILENTTKQRRLTEFMQTYGYTPENTIIIGDSAEEPEIARHTGLTSISITGGVLSETRLRAAKPDYIVHSLKAVPEIIHTVWKDIPSLKLTGDNKIL